MRCSIVLPIAVTRPEQAVPFANLVRWTQAERLWQGQSQTIDNHHLVSWLAGLGIRVPSGFGVNLTPLRSPYQAAAEARSTALATGQPVLAAYGPGGVEFQRNVLGEPYRSPLTAVSEYVSTVRGLVRGELVHTEGEHYSTTARLVPVRAPEVRVGIGVLRPRMAELAGRVADDAVTWLCPPDHLRDVIVPRVRKGSADAGRDPVPVTAIVPCAVAREGRDARETAFATFGMHIQVDHYQDTLRHAGITVTGEKEDADKLIDAGLFLYGTPSDIRDGLQRFAQAGVEEVVLNVQGVSAVAGARAAAQDLEEILRAL
ncbi:LLM class flavin-dependent oxidoreductase [Streptomyces sp. TLI_185]|uniref:LLM class flavin-dependent oxidoreductase n=1 Tax=Streptomyces sp. TLI_185 TaxID=2485151 RepID=UPI000FB65D24|nr:LLM class flavin-dependent oxidoreductase [Streptomyces sp. TLI_185]RPF34480.1 alkanesulfonate monooxygenase SsuD/methylene tetrahydromethanopterin reductase-like flavin-dependent oxidoreductase (luciferase family) [Streptomyces sp. TLI_185]